MLLNLFGKNPKRFIGDKAQDLRTHTALSEHLNSMPSTHIGELTITFNFSSRDMATLGSKGNWTHVHINTHRHTQIYIIKNKKLLLLRGELPTLCHLAPSNSILTVRSWLSNAFRSAQLLRPSEFPSRSFPKYSTTNPSLVPSILYAKTSDWHMMASLSTKFEIRSRGRKACLLLGSYNQTWKIALVPSG